MNNRYSTNGFTLAEILIVTSILVVISLAVFTTLNSGLNLWQRINLKTDEEDIAIFFSKISSDLTNCFVFSGIEFKGEKNLVNLPTIIKREVEEFPSKIGRISYFLDDSTITRTTQNYSEIYQEKAGFTQKLISRVNSLAFYYFYYDPSAKNFIWTDIWPVKKSSESEISRLPLAVRVDFRMESDDSIYSKIISIPASR